MADLWTGLPPWGRMWALAVGIFALCKVFTWARHRGRSSAARALGYLFLWPGMDARAFLDGERRPARPGAGEALFALAKTAFGAALVWFASPLAEDPLLRGWIGLVGTIFVLHFGTFHLVSIAWRAAGVEAAPIMRAPILATSLGDFWGRRWNLGFHDVARDVLYSPLAPRFGPTGAALAVFAASGLVHDLVISLPAGGGFGLPTAYFVLQGVGILVERAARLKGIAARGFALLVATGPALGLFHPPFVRNVFLPFLEAIGA